ncbi:MAG: response regulator transcription factor [Victivallaceae bacterium]|nr:response regulator transcription factor [Victivallaceae bacterium]
MRLLVVEDEKKIAGFILKGLKEEGYAVDHAENGHDALSMAAVYAYDLIITDIIMPGIDGFELVRQLREMSFQAPIMMLSAKDQIDDKIIGLDAGADDYLAKPFAFNELLARIRALLRRKSDYKEKLTVADLIMEPDKHTVTRAGRHIELTPKEYALLEFLLRNQNRVVTRTSIIEHVWDMHFDSDTNLVDVFMSYLRKKIEPKAATRLIHSVRGVGYILKEEV